MLSDAGMHRRARRVVRMYAQKAQNSAASAAKSKEPFWASWGKGGQAQGSGLGAQAQSWWQNMHTQARSWKPPKWEMPGLCSGCMNHMMEQRWHIFYREPHEYRAWSGLENLASLPRIIVRAEQRFGITGAT